MSNSSQTCRLILQNLPKNADEKVLTQKLGAVGLTATDIRVMRTKGGESRRFGFIGFKEASHAEKAKKSLDKAFIGTCRISANFALPVDNSQEVKVWGKDARERKYKLIKEKKEAESRQRAEEAEAKRKAQEEEEAKKEKLLAKANVKADKIWKDNGEDEIAVADENSSDDEEFDQEIMGDAEVPGQTPEEDKAAFDDDLDDLAYLKSRMVVNSEEAGPKEELQEEQEDHEDEEEMMKEEGACSAASKESHAEDGLAEHGRVLVLNIPYSATEEEIQKHFEKYGIVGSVHLPLWEHNNKPRGFCFVTFDFPEQAVSALAAENGSLFQGRIIRVQPAKPTPRAHLEKEGEKKNLSWKQQQLQKKREKAGELAHTWNLLYMSGNAAAAAIASQLGVKKSAILDLNSKEDDLAVRMAVAETELIKQTKGWLKEHGIRVEAFERKGDSALTASFEGERSKDTLILKHLPARQEGEDLEVLLRPMVAKFGALDKFTMPPSQTVALARFKLSKDAKKCFEKLSFRMFKHVPLYIEWAPVDVFEEQLQKTPEQEKRVESASTAPEAPADVREKVKEEVKVQEFEGKEGERARLFVKNLSFDTSDEALRKVFSKLKGFKTAYVMKKKKEGSGGEVLSMGYGFAEFESGEAAVEALKRKQGVELDGHSLKIQVSTGGAAKKEISTAGAKAHSANVDEKQVTKKLLVRNLDFSVSKAEVRKIFSSYGNVVSVRLPQKVDPKSGARQGRGFAFVEFLSKNEALAALEALQHSHVMGRRLVLEPASHEAETLEGALEKAKRKMDQREGFVESKAKQGRRRAQLEENGKGFTETM